MFPEVRHKKSLKEVLPKVAGSTRAAKSKAPPEESPTPPRRPKKTGGRWVYPISLVLILVIVIYWISSLLTRASVTVMPRRANLELAETVTANKSQAAGTGLTYEVVVLPGEEAKRSLKASGSAPRQDKAKGTVTISNNFNSTSQTLVGNTRLADPQGRIYRLTKEVVVPGQKTEGGKKVAGTVTAEIVAEGAGESYNSDEVLKFTIPGFKGSPRYESFSAEAVGPIKGGLAGTVAVVPEAAKAQATAELKQELRAHLLTAARAQIPAEFVLFDDAIFLNFVDKTDWTNSQNNEVELVLSAELRGIIFERQALSQRLIGSKLPDLAKLKLLLVNLDQLAFILNQKDKLNVTTANQISFSLSGQGQVQSQVDKTALTQALQGVKKSQANQVLGQFREINQAEVIFRPPWARRFPTDPGRIVVVDALN